MSLGGSLEDAISNAIKDSSTKDKIEWRGTVEVSYKGVPMQLRLVIISSYKFFIFNQHTLEIQLPLLELGIIESADNGVLTLRFLRGLKISLAAVEDQHHIQVKPDNINQFVKVIREVVFKCIPHWPSSRLELKIDSSLLDPLEDISIGPSGGILRTYYAFSCARKQKPHKDLVNFLKDISKSGTNELDLSLCPGIQETNCKIDFCTLCLSLEYNQHFESLIITNVTHPSISQFIGILIKNNNTLKKLVLNNVGTYWNANFGSGFLVNKDCKISILDVSNNEFLQEGLDVFIKGISSFQKTWNHGLSVLNLSNTKITSDSFCDLFDILSENWGLSLSIEELDISQNKLDKNASDTFNRWLVMMGSDSSIRRLSIANTGIEVLTALPVLRNFSALEYLNISGNIIHELAGTSSLVSLVDTTKSLKTLSVSNCGLNALMLISFLTALFQNENITELSLDISGNKVGNVGHELTTIFAKSKSLYTLNISNMDLGFSGISSIIKSLPTCLKKLISNGNCYPGEIDENFGSALHNMFVSHPVLTEFSMQGTPSSGAIIGPEILDFFKTLKYNDTLTYLDVSNNECGDEAFMALCRALHKNKTLKRVDASNNLIGQNSHTAIRQILHHNDTLLDFIYDTQVYLETNKLTCPTFKELRFMNQGTQLSINPFDFYINWPVPDTVTPLAEIPSRLGDTSVQPVSRKKPLKEPTLKKSHGAQIVENSLVSISKKYKQLTSGTKSSSRSLEVTEKSGKTKAPEPNDSKSSTPSQQDPPKAQATKTKKNVDLKNLAAAGTRKLRNITKIHTNDENSNSGDSVGAPPPPSDVPPPMDTPPSPSETPAPPSDSPPPPSFQSPSSSSVNL